jgi:ribosomal protein S18 acetylase RimI-like enzyme
MTMPTSQTQTQAALTLVPTRPPHLAELSTWFRTERACREWGGPSFRFPFDVASFRADTRYQEIPSYSLLRVGADELLGFGQYYLRNGRCHFARLAIAPDHRGHRLGVELVNRLATVGRADLGATACSLFVLASNAPALRLYERLGFVHARWPDDASPLEGGLYMVRDAATAAPWETDR